MSSQDESPRWLAERGRYDETREVIARLTGRAVDDPGVKAELHAIRQDLQGYTKESMWGQLKAATSSGKMFYRCSVPVILMTFQQWTGINAINYVSRHCLRSNEAGVDDGHGFEYSPIIFKELGFKSALAGLIGTGLYGLIKIIMTATALTVGIEQYGRKAMLVWGGLGQASWCVEASVTRGSALTMSTA